MIPKKFKQRYKKIIPDFDKFLDYYNKRQAVSIRVNTIKTSKEDFLSMTHLRIKPVKWYGDAFFVDTQHAAHVASTLEYFLGHIYLQDAASMVPPLVLAPHEGERVLDLTAAPGSKTTQMSQMMNNRGCIIANDNAYERIKALRGNINRLGCMNVVITRRDVRSFPASENERFDKVLLDAPCSLEGSMRKYFIHWSEGGVRSLALLQKKMIDAAWPLVKRGGELVYSTCTYAPEENEGVVQHLLQENEDAVLEKIKVKGLDHHEGITEFRDTTFNAELRKTARIYIHDYNTGGFFIAKIRKER